MRIGFVGLIDYQPNFDAVRWFATEVLPRVRRSVPDAVFHVMGHAGPEVARLGRYEGVRFLGYVPDLAPELAELSMLVAPIRFGGGTRFKILEGFAHEIPVVSTTVGAEGLDARDGEHLLVRDDPDAFARAVVELHQEAERRHRLIANGAALYEARYTWDRGVAAVQDEVASLAAATVRP